MSKWSLLMIAGAMIAAPASAGTGWSRASDLSVWSAMRLYGGIAREQSVLCAGFAPGRVAVRWDERYGAREAILRDALAARYGAGAVVRAGDPHGLRQPCRPVPDGYWERRYVRLLRLLESRMDPAWPGLAPRRFGTPD